MIKPELIASLRKEAEEQAKQVLKNQKNFSKKDLKAKELITKKFKSGKHIYLKQSEIDYCVNNDLDVGYLYDEMDSKYSGDIGKPPRKYYTPTGKPRGRRPKQKENEQEQ
jgi:hypothetical protein